MLLMRADRAADELRFRQALALYDEFLARYGGTFDAMTTIDRGRRYRVRAPAAHPVYERERAERFRQLLGATPDE